MNINVKKILIKTRKQVFSGILGNNSSLLKGEGYDFLELKEYEYGEDVKNIDWIISAKLQKPYVKVFHAQKELNINIVPILNGSMFFGTKRLKKDLANEVCSLLAYISVKQGDPFSSFIANENLTLLSKKSKKSFAVNDMLIKLDDYDCLGKKLSYENIANSLFKTIKNKSIIFLIGDFFDVSNLDLKLLSKKHEVYAIIIRDKFEEKPSEMGNISFKDPMTFSAYEGSITKASIKHYEKEVKSNDHLLYEHFSKCSIKSVKIYTNEEVLIKIIGLLK